MADIRGCLFQDELLYDQELNLWFRRIDQGLFEVGITPFGLALSGEVYLFNPKPDGREIELGRAFALIEVAKTILPVRVPFAATVVSSNPAVMQSPGLISRAPYDSWLARLSVASEIGLESLISSEGLYARALELMDAQGFVSLENHLKNQT